MSDIEDEVHFDSADSGDEWGPNQEDELSELEDVYADNNDVIELEYEDNSDISLSEYEISSFVDKQFYSAKNGTVWSTKSTYNAQMPAHNILQQRSGPIKSTINLSICDLFKSFLDSTIYDIILRHTNQKAKSVCSKWNVENPTKKKI